MGMVTPSPEKSLTSPGNTSRFRHVFFRLGALSRPSAGAPNWLASKLSLSNSTRVFPKMGGIPVQVLLFGLIVWLATALVLALPN